MELERTLYFFECCAHLLYYVSVLWILSVNKRVFSLCQLWVIHLSSFVSHTDAVDVSDGLLVDILSAQKISILMFRDKVITYIGVSGNILYDSMVTGCDVHTG